MKMKILLAMCVAFQFAAGGGSSSCRPAAQSGATLSFSIPSSCSSYEQGYSTGSGGTGAAQIYSGTIGSSVCSVYEGTNKNGALLGTFTGDGSSSGIIKSSTGSVYFSCVKSGSSTFGASFVFMKVNEEASCDVELDVYDLPTTLVLPTTSNGKMLQYSACNYTVTSPSRCNFTIRTSSAAPMSRTNYANGLYILSDDPLQPGKAIASNSEEVTTVQATRVNVQIYVWGVPVPPTIRIDTDFSFVNELKCRDTVAINAYYRGLTLLESNGDDELYISNRIETSLHDVSERCKAKANDPIFQFRFNECPSVKQVSGNVVSYVYRVRNLKPSNQVVVRTSNIPYWDVTCSYNVSDVLNTVVRVGTGSVSSKLEQRKVLSSEKIANTTVIFELFSDAQMTKPLTSQSIVTVPEYIYAKVDSTGNANLMLKSCWMTNPRSEGEGLRYNVIENSCKVVREREPEDTIVVLRNYQPTYAQFKFRSFVWNNVSSAQHTLYAHCYVQLCDNTDNDCSQPDCGSQKRKRRSVDESLDVVSVGPFYVSSPDPCGQDNGGCSDFCNIMDGAAQCSCFKDRYLDKDDKTCIALRMYDKEQQALKGEDMKNLDGLYIAVGFIALLVVVVLGLIVWFLKRRLNKTA